MGKLKYYLSHFPLGKAVKFFMFYAAKKVLNPHAKVFYSQHGEDGIILNLIGKKNGFYVDVGCNHPIKESNTFSLYVQQGWLGINIDANDTLTKEFTRTRSADTVLCNAVSDTEEELNFYEFHCDTISTVNKEAVDVRTNVSEIKQVRKVQARTLTNILREQIGDENKEIDLLTIDVEGHDMNVLRSLDLTIFRPKLIVIEIEDFDFANPFKNEVVSYLTGHGYNIEAFDSKNGYFLRERRKALWAK